MDHTPTPASESLIRDLWNQTFAPLVFPSDFLAQWLIRDAFSFHCGVEQVATFWKKHPDKDALSIAKVLSAQLSQAARDKTSHMQFKGTICDYCVTVQDVATLWMEHFPAMQLPSHFLEKWLADRRKHSTVRQAFEITARIHESDPKGVDDICRMASAQIKRLAVMEARNKVAEYKSRQTQEVA
jgi:hypothetical protein